MVSNQPERVAVALSGVVGVDFLWAFGNNEGSKHTIESCRILVGDLSLWCS